MSDTEYDGMRKDIGVPAPPSGHQPAASAGYATATPSSRSGVPNADCAFCGKAGNEAFRIIAGATASICDECALLCADIVKAEHESDGRGTSCPGCGQRISLMAAAGKDQRWGMTLHPGPSGLLQAATIAGAIDGAQRMMRLSCREDGANVQTYVEKMETADDGSVTLSFATLPVSKKWAKANGRPASVDGSPEGGDGLPAPSRSDDSAVGEAETP